MATTITTTALAGRAKDCRHLVPDPTTHTLLCARCEKALRWELSDAKKSCDALWASASTQHGEEACDASQRYVKAAVKVANYEDRMADRSQTIAQLDAKQASELSWKAGRRVAFEGVGGEGMAPGEKKKVKEEKKAIVLGWAQEAMEALETREEAGRFELPLRFKEEEEEL